MIDVDALISSSLVSAAADDGMAPEILAFRDPVLAPIFASRLGSKRQRTRWSEVEDRFIEENWGRLSEGEISIALGRSSQAVHLHVQRRMRLPCPTKDPRFITTNQISIALGIDAHKAVSYFDRGLFPGEICPSDCGYVIRRVLRKDFYSWAINPASWIWFDPDRIVEPHLARLIAVKKERWGDEWWTTNQVASYHGVENKDVVRYIKLGKLAAVHAENLGGRNNHGWAYWFVLRSEATRPGLRFVKGGRGRLQIYEQHWNESADAFIVLARAAGMPCSAIAILTGYPEKRVAYRSSCLVRYSRIPWLVQRYGLTVEYRPESGEIFADWRECVDRLPSLEKAIRRFLAGRTRKADLSLLRGVLARWASWHLGSDWPDLVSNITHGMVAVKSCRRWYRELQTLNVDPFERA